jgi:hypothetical protein
VTLIESHARRRTKLPGARSSSADLAAVVRAVAADEAQWRPRVQHRLYGRYYECLLADDDHEVWLICWEVGQMTLLHDHGGAAGAFTVVAGTLVEDYGRPGAGRLQQRRVARGGLRSFGSRYVHNLVNPGPGLVTSIHAYSPRLTTMTYYAVLPGGAVPVRTLPVETPEPPAR